MRSPKKLRNGKKNKCNKAKKIAKRKYGDWTYMWSISVHIGHITQYVYLTEHKAQIKLMKQGGLNGKRTGRYPHYFSNFLIAMAITVSCFFFFFLLCFFLSSMLALHLQLFLLWTNSSQSRNLISWPTDYNIRFLDEWLGKQLVDSAGPMTWQTRSFISVDNFYVERQT